MINTQEVKIPHPRKSHPAARQPVSTSIRHARHTWFCVMMCLATASWGTSALLQTPQTQIHPPAPTPGVPVYLGGGIGSEKIVSAKRKKRARTKRWKNEVYVICPVKSSELQQKDQPAMKRRFSSSDTESLSWAPVSAWSVTFQIIGKK